LVDARTVGGLANAPATPRQSTANARDPACEGSVSAGF